MSQFNRSHNAALNSNHRYATEKCVSSQAIDRGNDKATNRTMNWTTEQILALAPDAASAKAGQGLATARKWQTLGADEQTAWGLCQGSGKDPYQTQIDLTEPAFRCSCPSRKFPCKHGLGLFLLLALQPASFKEKRPPDWVVEWMEIGRAHV